MRPEVTFFFYRKRDARKIVIYSSTNPEYISLAANYIPDGYEVDLKDIELTKVIGHGNFGKVRFIHLTLIIRWHLCKILQFVSCVLEHCTVGWLVLLLISIAVIELYRYLYTGLYGIRKERHKRGRTN